MMKPNRKLLASLLLASAFVGSAGVHATKPERSACALAALPSEHWLLSVPFDVIDGRIYLQAKVNGQGPYRFAVDTGASGQARADASLVSTLGLEVHARTSNSDGVSTTSADLVRLDSVEVGGLLRRDLEVITRDYGGSAPEASFSGIIAREFFDDGLLVIDYPERVLRFSRSLALTRDDRGALPYQRAFRIPVSIGDLATVGNLDTGANVAFALPRAMYDKLAGTTTLQKAGNGTLSNTVIETGRATVHGPFRMGGIALADVETRVSDRLPELLVGAHALQGLVLAIDQRSRAVALCR